MTPLASPEIIHLLKTYGYLALGLGVGVESLGIPFPGETLLVAAAVYAGLGHLAIGGVITAAASGAIIGDNIGYILGLYGGKRFLVRFGRYIKIYPEHLAYAEKYFQKHGGKTVFFGRFVAFLRMWSALLAGANNMSWRRFLFYNAAGGIAWSAFYGILGYLLGRNVILLARILHAIGIVGFITLFVALIIVIVAWRRVLRDIEVRLPGEKAG